MAKHAKQWDKIFRKYGKVFTKVQEDISRVVKLFKERGVKRVLDLGCGQAGTRFILSKT